MSSINSELEAMIPAATSPSAPNVSSVKRRTRIMQDYEKPSLRDRLREVDQFPKAVDDSETSTRSSVLFSGITIVFAQIQLIHQVLSWQQVRREEHIVIDTIANEPLRMFLDVTFPKLQCSVCIVDVMDVSGDMAQSYSQGLRRQRLDGSGHPIHKAIIDDEPVSDLYGEGCRLQVSLDLAKIAGNVHIAVGGEVASYTSSASPKVSPHGEEDPKEVEKVPVVYRTRKHIHKFTKSQLKKFDATHTINELRFGPRFPGQVLPLEGFNGKNPYVATYQYLIKIVPTIFKSPTSETVVTNQYNYQKAFHYLDLESPQAGSIPGLFLIYDFSPYRVEILEKSMTLLEFIVSLCAIVGGAITSMAILFRLVRWIGDTCMNRDVFDVTTPQHTKFEQMIYK